MQLAWTFTVSSETILAPESCSDAPNAVTLIFAHCTGSLNEHWEPTLEHLYDVLTTQNKNDSSAVKIREAWCIEAPNHGESYVLNEEVLSWGYSLVCEFPYIFV